MVVIRGPFITNVSSVCVVLLSVVTGRPRIKLVNL